MRKISQIGFKLSSLNLLDGIADFKDALSKYFNKKYIVFTGSGTSAFFLILEALKNMYPAKNEVILPSYTAPAMLLPIKKAGFKPILGDISLFNFNLDLNGIDKLISKKTLCIVPTHLFGMINSGIKEIKQKYPEVFIIEDCAQAMGSCPVGEFSDAVFFSFNRGKNISTDGGGAIVTDLSIDFSILKDPGLVFKILLPLKMLLLSFAIQPIVYGLLYNLISYFKDNQVPSDFSLLKYTNIQAGFGLSQLKRLEESSQERYANGMYLIKNLQDEKLILPTVADNSRLAFNRLPVCFKNLSDRDKVEIALQKVGIDTSRMYQKPLHHIFDLGYKKEEFPNADFLAEHLLTLPVHPLVKKEDLDRIVAVIKEALT